MHQDYIHICYASIHRLVWGDQVFSLNGLSWSFCVGSASHQQVHLPTYNGEIVRGASNLYPGSLQPPPELRMGAVDSYKGNHGSGAEASNWGGG